MEAVHRENGEVTLETDAYPFSLEIEPSSATLLRAAVTLPKEIVAALYENAATHLRYTTHSYGFSQKTLPLDYVKTNFREHLITHLKEFLLKFAVINFINHEIRVRKLPIFGNPRLISIDLTPENNAHFHFEMSTFHDVDIEEWRHLPFKPPTRKGYKDLDRQVKILVDREQEALDSYTDRRIVDGDWVNFDISLVDADHKETSPQIRQNFWLRVTSDETESVIHEAFIGAQLGDVIYTKNRALQEYFSSQLDTDYTFRVEIRDVVPHQFLNLDDFKRYFRIKTKKSLHSKLIEVFSYRNHLSQRHAMVQEMINLVSSRNSFTVPNHLVLRQQRIILEDVQHNPDYNVYRAERDFPQQVRELAEKQTRETILIDALSYRENMPVSLEDTRCYLSLASRHRIKDFIYFEQPSSKVMGQEAPIPLEVVKRSCLREKMANHIIYHLTKD